TGPLDAPLGGDVRDGGDGGLVCQAADPVTCTNAQKAADAVAVTFAGKACTDPTVHKCGGVSQGGVTVTDPLKCEGGAWAYAWCLSAVCYTCSTGCAVGQ